MRTHAWRNLPKEHRVRTTIGGVSASAVLEEKKMFFGKSSNMMKCGCTSAHACQEASTKIKQCEGNN